MEWLYGNPEQGKNISSQELFTEYKYINIKTIQSACNYKIKTYHAGKKQKGGCKRNPNRGPCDWNKVLLTNLLTFDKISTLYDNVLILGDINYDMLSEHKGAPLKNVCDILITEINSDSKFSYTEFTLSHLSTIEFKFFCSKSFKKNSWLKYF
jgi:hypothetical protein